MNLTIPFQALEIGNIHLMLFMNDKYGKSLARLTYKDNSLDFHDVCILSPPLKVIDYNSESSRLRLDLSEQPQFQNKLQTLQDYLITTFFVHQHSFLALHNQSHEHIKGFFQFLLVDNILSIYLFPTTTVKKADDTPCKVLDLLPNNIIRCAIRLQGVSQLTNKYGKKLRLQHSIPSIWFIE